VSQLRKHNSGSAARKKAFLLRRLHSRLHFPSAPKASMSFFVLAGRVCAALRSSAVRRSRTSATWEARTGVRTAGAIESCIVPAISFCEYADTQPRKTPKWFALDAARPRSPLPACGRPGAAALASVLQRRDLEAGFAPRENRSCLVLTAPARYRGPCLAMAPSS
jgi:hypothetical protein